MELKLFHRTQRDLANSINNLIDGYWNNEITEQLMIENIKALHDNNTNKFTKGKNFTTIIQQQCGKRRLEVVKKILNIECN